MISVIVNESGDMEVARLSSAFDIELVPPKGFSFFEPYLQYFVREVLEIGGEAFVSRASDGNISGLFIYDDFEKHGTVFTRSREVFDYFCRLKPFNFLFAELKTEVESEVYDIYSIDLENQDIVHRFSYEILVTDGGQLGEIERFMVLANPGMNRRWTRVALKNGDKCFTVRLDGEIAGLGWVSFVGGIGRMHSLFVKPQFRKLGIGEDILYARLLWLKSKNARLAFSEISHDNFPSSRIASKAQMSVCGQVFQYLRKNLVGGEITRL
ncbi:MAG TPA: GNAT family N-acetyltransferase [Candidatus Bathyarchaeia archaeon]